jgi:hypothetical protein
MEGFQLEPNLIWLTTPKTSTLPQKSQHEHPFEGVGIFHLPTNIFMSLKNMKEHFQLSSSFEETVMS